MQQARANREINIAPFLAFLILLTASRSADSGPRNIAGEQSAYARWAWCFALLVSRIAQVDSRKPVPS